MMDLKKKQTFSRDSTARKKFIQLHGTFSLRARIGCVNVRFWLNIFNNVAVKVQLSTFIVEKNICSIFFSIRKVNL